MRRHVSWKMQPMEEPEPREHLLDAIDWMGSGGLWGERMSRQVLAPTRDIPPGSRKLFTVKGKLIAIFNLDGDFFGMLERCPHQNSSLCEGAVTGLLRSSKLGEYTDARKGEIIRCPWHGWEFDIALSFRNVGG